jgi:hypothetical protein
MVDVTCKRPRKSSETSEGRENEKLGTLLLEMDALHTTLQVVDQGVDSTEAVVLTRMAFNHDRPANSAEERLIFRAMAKILDMPVALSSKLPAKAPWERRVFESVAHAWVCWANDPNSEIPLEEIPKLRSAQRGTCKQAGAVHLLALYFWAAAVEALAKSDRAEARRLWRRAIEIGSSFGTPSNAAVLWSYAASFFPAVTPKESSEGLRTRFG